jgi:hypothetical protein
MNAVYVTCFTSYWYFVSGKQSDEYQSHVYFNYAYGEAGFTAHFPQVYSMLFVLC